MDKNKSYQKEKTVSPILLIILFIVLALALIFLIYCYLRGPKSEPQQSTTTSPTTSNTNTQSPEDEGLVYYYFQNEEKGIRLHFKYPKDYEVKSETLTGAGMIDKKTFQKNGVALYLEVGTQSLAELKRVTGIAHEANCHDEINESTKEELVTCSCDTLECGGGYTFTGERKCEFIDYMNKALVLLCARPEDYGTLDKALATLEFGDF